MLNTRSKIATVWLVHSVKYDLAKAEQFGELKSINARYVYGDELTSKNRMPPDMDAALDKAADEFEPSTDFLLLIGDDLQLAAFASKLGARYESYKVLRYDRQAQGYFEVVVEVPDGD